MRHACSAQQTGSQFTTPLGQLLQYHPSMRRFALFALLVALPVAVPAQAPTGSIKSPEEAFGFRMGTDRQLAGMGGDPQVLRRCRGGVESRRAHRRGADDGRQSAGCRRHLGAREHRAARRDPQRHAAPRRSASHQRNRRSRIGGEESGDGGHRRQHPRDGDRRHAGGQRAAPHAGHIGRSGDRGRAAQHGRDPVSLAQSGRPSADGGLVSPVEGHRVRGVADAVALSPLRRPRHQPRRVHDEHGGEPLARGLLLPPLASAGFPVDAPDGHARPALLRAAQLRSDRSQLRPAHLADRRPPRSRDGARHGRARPIGRRAERDVRLLLARV